MPNLVYSDQEIELVGQKKLNSPIKAMELTPDNNFLFTGDKSGYVHKWDPQKLISYKNEKSHSEVVNDIEIFDERYVVSTSSDERIVIRDFDLNYVNEEFLFEWIFSIDISHDGNYIISAGIDKKIHLFPFNLDNCINTIDAHADWVNDIRFCDNSKKIISVSDDKQIKIFNTSGSKANKDITAGSAVKNICFNPNGEIVACGTVEGEIFIIDLNSFN